MFSILTLTECVTLTITEKYNSVALAEKHFISKLYL